MKLVRRLRIGILFGLVLFAYCVWPVQGQAPDAWPMYQADLAHTGYNPGETVLKPPLELAWVYTFDPQQTRWRESRGGVAINDGVAYAAVGYEIVALRVEDGSKLWSYHLPGRWATGAHERATSDTMSLCFVDGVVYGVSDLGRLYALDAKTGQPRWIYVAPPFSSGDFSSGPIQADGLAYWGSFRGSLFAVREGNLAWTADLKQVVTAPALAEGKLFVTSVRGAFAFDAQSGAMLWNVAPANSTYTTMAY